MNRSVGRLLVLCVGILIALGAFGVARLAGASCSPFTHAPCTRVLFLGNSYTYVNDLPTVFREQLAILAMSFSVSIPSIGIAMLIRPPVR